KYTSHFQTWSWGEFERDMGHKFENLGIYKSGRLIGLMPIKHVRAKRGRYLQLRHGPIFDFKDKDLLEYFKTFIRSKAKREGYWFVRMSPLVPVLEEKNCDLKDFKECSLHN